MALEVVQRRPELEDYALLSQHQEQTPSTFYGGKPVLHLHSPSAEIKFSKLDLTLQPTLRELGDVIVSDEEIEGGDVRFEGVDVWVGSSSLLLYSPGKASGVKIPYQAIVVHAQDNDAVLLGLNLSDANTSDEDMTFIQIRIIPTQINEHENNETTQSNSESNGDALSSTPVVALFKAVSACQELNPDPPEDDEMDETAPGTTGWITSDNMSDFLDENGEFKMPTLLDGDANGGVTVIDALGEGAGRTRTAAELEAEDEVEDERKWQRTD